MLSLAKFPTHTHYDTLIHKPIAQYLQFSTKPQLSFSTRRSFKVHLGKSLNGLHSAVSITRNIGELNLTEMDGPDESEDNDFDDEFSDVDDDEGEIDMPLMQMKKWLENRPRGFGEGKVYDTSMEDKLVEEIEQSKKAQFSNVNELTKGTVILKPGSKKEINKKDKGFTQIQEGFRACLFNLPKKKNVHKDLRLAFNGVRGIINIVPLVSGNEKTRDPVCTGLAFVDFKNHDDAHRFVQNISGKSITFGKVQKQIKCELANSKKSSLTRDQSVDGNNFTFGRGVHKLAVKNDVDVEIEVSQLDSLDEIVPNEVDDKEVNESCTNSHSEGFETNSPPLKQTKRSKKVGSKPMKDEIPKLKIPGSAKRLRVREKEMLTGALSKYATAKEHSR